MAFWDACHQLVNAGCSSKPGGRDGVIVPQIPLRMPIAMLPRMLTRKAMKRACLAESHRISPTLVDTRWAGRFDRKLAGVGDAESAGINSGWRNLSAKENQGASINNRTACNATPSFLKLSLDLVGIASSGADCPTNNNLNVEMNMKRIMPWMIGTVTLCAAATLALGAGEMLPGQVDFGAFSAPKGEGEFVEVNVPTGLIALAAVPATKARFEPWASHAMTPTTPRASCLPSRSWTP